MTRRNKLLKFTEILTFSNVYETTEINSPILSGEDGKLAPMNGQWQTNYFQNDNPITVELACGKGDYTIALAERYPERNFIGVDIKGARIWKGAKIAQEKALKNVVFLRCKIEFIAQYFDEGEISEMWITFPDPFLKDSKFNRRMTSPAFIESYKKVLQPDSVINVKTDSPEFYDHTKSVLTELKIPIIDDYYDIYAEEKLPHPDLDIKTYYELKHLKIGRKIKYLKFNPSVAQ
jgi:tRNA (guanine-N7-)-methyltransferase